MLPTHTHMGLLKAHKPKHLETTDLIHNFNLTL